MLARQSDSVGGSKCLPAEVIALEGVNVRMIEC